MACTYKGATLLPRCRTHASNPGICGRTEAKFEIAIQYGKSMLHLHALLFCQYISPSSCAFYFYMDRFTFSTLKSRFRGRSASGRGSLIDPTYSCCIVNLWHVHFMYLKGPGMEFYHPLAARIFWFQDPPPIVGYILLSIP